MVKPSKTIFQFFLIILFTFGLLGGPVYLTYHILTGQFISPSEESFAFEILAFQIIDADETKNYDKIKDGKFIIDPPIDILPFNRLPFAVDYSVNGSNPIQFTTLRKWNFNPLFIIYCQLKIATCQAFSF